jgi:hypothetical protein
MQLNSVHFSLCLHAELHSHDPVTESSRRQNDKNKINTWTENTPQIRKKLNHVRLFKSDRTILKIFVDIKTALAARDISGGTIERRKDRCVSSRNTEYRLFGKPLWNI